MTAFKLANVLWVAGAIPMCLAKVRLAEAQPRADSPRHYRPATSRRQGVADKGVLSAESGCNREMVPAPYAGTSREMASAPI